MTRRAIVVAAVLAAPVAAAAPAQLPPTVTASPTDLRVGTELTIGCIVAATGDPGFVVALLQGPGEPYGTGALLWSGVAESDGSFEFVVTISDPLPNGDLVVAVACFEADPPTSDGTIELYPPVPVTAQSPPITGLVVDRTTLSFDDPCAGITSSMGVSALATLIGPSGEEILLDAVEGVAGRVSYPLPDVLAVGEWTVVAECYRRRESRPEVIQVGTFVREPITPDPVAPAPPPATPVEGDATYTG